MKISTLAPPVLALLLGAVGCESLTGEHSVFRSRESQTATDAEEHRARFLETRNAEDLQWLLKNSIRSGMSRGCVISARSSGVISSIKMSDVACT